MTSQHDKAKRWRPRFSVRTLAILVTLVCAYLTCWVATGTRGVNDVAMHITVKALEVLESTEDPQDAAKRADHWGARAYVPFVVVATLDIDSSSTARLYYFWFFGYIAKLPHERELPATNRW